MGDLDTMDSWDSGGDQTYWDSAVNQNYVDPTYYDPPPNYVEYQYANAPQGEWSAPYQDYSYGASDPYTGPYEGADAQGNWDAYANSQGTPWYSGVSQGLSSAASGLGRFANSPLGLTAGMAGLGLYGANKAASAQEDAAKRAQQIAAQQQLNDARRYAPYGEVGAQGLAQMYGQNVNYYDPITGEMRTYAGEGGDFNLMMDPYTGETMQQPSYQQLSQTYEDDPSTRAQRALDSRRLGQAEQARVGYATPGASAAREAELGQKYDVQGFQNLYKNLQSEFAQKRAMTADRYDQLSQKMNLGLGATKQLSAAGQNYSTAAGQAATNAGAAQAGLWSGVAPAATNALKAGTLMGAMESGQNPGWWG